jgi:hypothetical protein
VPEWMTTTTVPGGYADFLRYGRKKTSATPHLLIRVRANHRARQTVKHWARLTWQTTQDL